MVRLTDRPDMTLDVYRGRKTTMQQQQQQFCELILSFNSRPPFGRDLSSTKATLSKNGRKNWKSTFTPVSLHCFCDLNKHK